MKAVRSATEPQRGADTMMKTARLRSRTKPPPAHHRSPEPPVRRVRDSEASGDASTNTRPNSSNKESKTETVTSQNSESEPRRRMHLPPPPSLSSMQTRKSLPPAGPSRSLVKDHGGRKRATSASGKLARKIPSPQRTRSVDLRYDVVAPQRTESFSMKEVGHMAAGKDKSADECNSNQNAESCSESTGESEEQRRLTEERLNMLDQFAQNCRACHPPGPYSLKPSISRGLARHRSACRKSSIKGGNRLSKTNLEKVKSGQKPQTGDPMVCPECAPDNCDECNKRPETCPAKCPPPCPPPCPPCPPPCPPPDCGCQKDPCECQQADPCQQKNRSRSKSSCQQKPVCPPPCPPKQTKTRQCSRPCCPACKTAAKKTCPTCPPMGHCSGCTRRWPYIPGCIKCPPKGYCPQHKPTFCPPTCCDDAHGRSDDLRPTSACARHKHEEDSCVMLDDEENPCCGHTYEITDDHCNRSPPACDKDDECEGVEHFADLTDDCFFQENRYDGFLLRALVALFGQGLCGALMCRTKELESLERVLLMLPPMLLLYGLRNNYKLCTYFPMGKNDEILWDCLDNEKWSAILGSLLWTGLTTLSAIMAILVNGLDMCSMIPLYYRIHWLWLVAGITGLTAAFFQNRRMYDCFPILHPATLFVLTALTLILAIICSRHMTRATNTLILMTLLALYGSAVYLDDCTSAYVAGLLAVASMVIGPEGLVGRIRFPRAILFYLVLYGITCSALKMTAPDKSCSKCRPLAITSPWASDATDHIIELDEGAGGFFNSSTCQHLLAAAALFAFITLLFIIGRMSADNRTCQHAPVNMDFSTPSPPKCQQGCLPRNLCDDMHSPAQRRGSETPTGAACEKAERQDAGASNETALNDFRRKIKSLGDRAKQAQQTADRRKRMKFKIAAENVDAAKKS